MTSLEYPLIETAVGPAVLESLEESRANPLWAVEERAVRASDEVA